MDIEPPNPQAPGIPGSPEGGKAPDDLIVVGVGASAGGLEALVELMGRLPPDTNLAFVVIQHLDPLHKSILPDLLSRNTSMQVVGVEQTVRIQANNIYVISPNTSLRVDVGRLVPEKRAPESFKPIDRFFESLATEFRERAMGIILSGTATDGTFGMTRIKAEGGITFAQDETAKFDSMPRSAIAAGIVDFVLPPWQIAEELLELARRPQLGREIPAQGDGATINRLLQLLRQHCGVDFTQYKQPTIVRRLNRRMLLRKTDTLEEYLEFVSKEPGELDALFDDLLINVTEFFRDPEVFEAAKRLAFPSIVQNRQQPFTIRVWIPGCSSGEEAYSMAIALTESLESQDIACAIQVFGTDLSDRAIEAARKAIYSESAVANVSPERLRRFFVRKDAGYEVGREIREKCIFSRHNVAKDPPLSRMDVISCRNLLIYFSPSIQRKVIGIFSYALRPTGCLMLGPSESLGRLAEHFSVVDESHKLYRRNTTAAPLPFGTGHTEDRTAAASGRAIRFPRLLPGDLSSQGGQVQRYADQIVLSRYGPVGLTVDESLRIKSYRGDVAEFLIAPEMPVDAELLDSVRTDLRAVLSTAIEQAQRTAAVVVGESATKEGNLPIAITVIPLSLAGLPTNLLIVFGGEREPSTIEHPPAKAPEDTAAKPEPSVEEENASLKQELKSTREYLQSVIQELRSANEEAQSANEELQSSNEELQTSKEELQSTNEELNTINAELQNRNSELAKVNDDLINLLASMNMPIVMTGRDLRIRRFTPIAEKILRLIPTDIGRPIADLKPRINVSDLEEVLSQVLHTLQPYERDVEDYDGHSYVMRVRPYRTVDDRIDGAILQLLDVSEIKRSLEQARYARDYAEAIVNTIREPLAVLDSQLRIRDANRSFYRAMEIREGTAAGESVFDVSSGQFGSQVIRDLFDQLKRGATELTDVEIEPKSRHGEIRTLLVNARRLSSPAQEELVLMAFEDITERKQAAEGIKAAEARYRRLFESARDGIVVVDGLTGDILDLNPYVEYLFGYRKDELIGRKLWEIDSMRNLPNARGALDQARERGTLRFDSFSARKKDGRDVALELIATSYSVGESQRIQLNMRDISERMKFERELQETQKLESLGLLAGGIAHDFNNLLTGVLGNASLALAHIGPDQPMRLRLRDIVAAAERAAFLTRQMLAYAGKGQFLTAIIDLSDLVREISALVRTSIPKAVDLKLDLAPKLPPIEADPAQIQQVLMNLVINGAEAIGENTGGTVTVRTSLREVSHREVGELFKSEPAEPGMYLQLEVIDTGIGMDEAIKARIFDPFFTTKFTGRGLGLAAVQGIVRQHRGVIFVHSAPGRGTTFRVLLPASVREADAQTREATAGSIPDGSVALVIDDEKVVLNIAEHVLSRNGMKVLTADNGRTGVELLREHGGLISVIILDLQMPVMGGEEALPLLREINPDIPVILSSGFDESDVSRRFSTVKPAGFLQKPFTAQRLESAVAAVLKNR
jgi:two-component system CheB/CheR fusion protein